MAVCQLKQNVLTYCAYSFATLKYFNWLNSSFMFYINFFI